MTVEAFLDLSFHALNGLRFALDMSLSVIFGRYLYLNRKDWSSTGSGAVRVRTALAFFIFMSGETVWRAFAWLNLGNIRLVVFMPAGIVAAAGSLCCLRVLLPEWWRWPTLSAMLVFISIILVLSILV